MGNTLEENPNCPERHRSRFEPKETFCFVWLTQHYKDVSSL